MLRARCRHCFLWTSFHHSLQGLVVHNSAFFMLDCDTAGQCALNRIVKEVRQDSQVQVVFPQCPQGKEAPVSLLDQV